MATVIGRREPCCGVRNMYHPTTNTLSPPDTSALDRLVGVSSWNKEVRRQILDAAPHDATVLITGPSGTGKELIAEAIHRLSPRCHGEFLAANCACLPSGLFESHLFGHVKGAFTGAHCDATGIFRLAEGGTLLLDEIGELDILQQAKLLRVIQTKKIRPIGGDREIPVNVRILAATNRDLLAQVAAGQFRKDLYYRLSVLRIETISLSDRPEDILVLAEHILDRLSIDGGMPRKRLTAAASQILRDHSWPGNVRELENLLERAVIMSRQPRLEAEQLAELMESSQGRLSSASQETGSSADRSAVSPAAEGAAEGAAERASATRVARSGQEPWPTMAQIERAHLVATLEQTGYNQSRAARLLNISRKALAGKIQRYAVDTTLSRRGRPAGGPASGDSASLSGSISAPPARHSPPQEP